MYKRNAALILIAALTLAGCQTNSREQLLMTDQSQLALRSFQQRSFETNDQEKTLRTIIATLQDLGFIIDKADLVLGTVSGTKLSNESGHAGYALQMTVSVRPRGKKDLIIRANAQYNLTAVEDPEPYQQFFAALEKSMFLTAHQVD